MDKHVVAAVDAAVPCGPDIAENGVVRLFDEMVDVVAGLVRHSHCGQLILVRPIFDRIEMEAELGLQAGIAAAHGLIKVVVRLIEVALRDIVAWILLQEAVRAGTEEESHGKKQSCLNMSFHTIVDVSGVRASD
jgi:hypothetical protein